MSCAHVREELGGYVLGALTPEEHEAIAAHLAGCPQCAAEHARLAGLPAMLVHADGLEIPAAPAGIAERVLDRIAHERGQRRPRRRPALGLGRWRGLVAGVLAGAALGAGVAALVLSGGSDPAPAGSYSLALTGAGGASARAELEPGRGGTEVHLWVKGLPAGGDAVYEVRCERPGWSATAGTFRADSRGRAYVVLTTAARIGEYERIRVVRRSKQAEADVLAGDIQ